jgi:ferredoxin
VAKRQVINIDDERCTGCGQCIPGCPEGALQIIEGKCRLISDLFCDGLGACIKECPEGAIKIEERDAEPYNETRVMENVAPHGPAVIKAHLLHLSHHGQDEYLAEAVRYLTAHGLSNPLKEAQLADAHPHGMGGGCPGARMRDMRSRQETTVEESHGPSQSCLTQWPVQLHLVSPQAPYFKDAHLLVAADCVPFASADFHHSFLKGKALAIFCPKLDSGMDEYVEKLAMLFNEAAIRSITIVHMEVPCCFGVGRVVAQALERAGKAIPVKDMTISIDGSVLEPA